MNPSFLRNHKLALKRERIENYVDKCQWCSLQLPFSLAVLKQSRRAIQGTFANTWRRGVVTTGGLLLASGRSRGQGYYQTPYETQQNPQQQRFICPKMSKTLVDKLLLMTLNKFFFYVTHCTVLYTIHIIYCIFVQQIVECLLLPCALKGHLLIYIHSVS